MVEIGKFTELRVAKEVDFGVYLDGGIDDLILLPTRYVPNGCKVDDILSVFIYLDSEERKIATTVIPFAQTDEFAYLQVNEVNEIGAFMEWGIMKNILVPFREQKSKMIAGNYYLVFVYLDLKTNRVVASAKIDSFIVNEKPELEVGEEVDILVYQQTDLGYKAIINNYYSGLLYKSELFQALKIGDKSKAYIKNIRIDNKIDLSLSKLGYEKITETSEIILNKLIEAKGFLPVTDKSPVEEINTLFGMSKKTFKMAIGGLFRKKLISIQTDGIKLIKE